MNTVKDTVSTLSGRIPSFKEYEKMRYATDAVPTLGIQNVCTPATANSGILADLHQNLQDEIQTLWRVVSVLENISGRLLGAYPPPDPVDKSEVNSAVETLNRDTAELSHARRRLEQLVEGLNHL